MMKWDKSYNKIAFYVLAILVTAYVMPVEKNWTPSFSQKHNWPYGSKVLYELLPDLFEQSDIELATLPFYNQDPESNDKLFWVTDRTLKLDSLELSSLLALVERGNDAFISSMDFPYRLTDTLGLSTEYNYGAFVAKATSSTDTLTHCFVGGSNPCITQKLIDSEEYFVRDSLSSLAQILAYDAEDSIRVAYIKVPYGAGHFYLHNQPFLLTNYAVLRPNGKAYLETLTSYLPNRDIVWDENHKLISAQTKQSPMHVVLSQPAFRWAYWLTILGLVLFFFIRAKRKQRAIPVVEAPKNSSMEFAETMGSLYFNQSNNKNLANKKISILKEYISRKLQLSDITFSENEIIELSNKSGKDEESISKMLRLINSIKNSTEVSDGQLTVLNKSINRFIKQ